MPDRCGAIYIKIIYNLEYNYDINNALLWYYNYICINKVIILYYYYMYITWWINAVGYKLINYMKIRI